MTKIIILFSLATDHVILMNLELGRGQLMMDLVFSPWFGIVLLRGLAFHLRGPADDSAPT
ncbi:MAG: hypothetical protein IT288_00015 [Bdellovibrionales bacterium]|nr:hypothetical protein [Bdellovibrionales bacterium]